MEKTPVMTHDEILRHEEEVASMIKKLYLYKPGSEQHYPKPEYLNNEQKLIFLLGRMCIMANVGSTNTDYGDTPFEWIEQISTDLISLIVKEHNLVLDRQQGRIKL